MVNQEKRARSVRQTVTLPAALAVDVRRVAQERRITVSRALVSLAERGIRAELEAKLELEAAYQNFVGAVEPEAKSIAGRSLIRAIFGNDAIAEDSVF
jgi:hypothetical protein